MGQVMGQVMGLRELNRGVWTLTFVSKTQDLRPKTTPFHPPPSAFIIISISRPCLNREESPLETAALDFFKRILATPSPSGYESAVQQVVRDYVAGFADQVTTDLHGNVIAARNPGAPLRIMLAGHCDQIGLIVQHIDDDGFLYVQPIGGWDPEVLIGQRMIVWTAGGPLPGVIAGSRSTCSPRRSASRCRR